MDPPDPERLLLTIADHLHAHCECRPGATGGARCAACDLRAQLRDVREQVLAWRAEWQRLRERRDDAVANGETHLARHAPYCVECDALAQVAAAMRTHRAPATPGDHSETSSS